MGNDNPNGDTAVLSLDKLLVESPEGALGYAKAYVDMGASVVPNDGKKPTLTGWPERRLTAAELPLHFGAGRNVGLLNGGPSGGLVTVDVDVPEAVKISGRFLPKTARSGREGTPDAHAWYRAPGTKTKKWQDVDGKVLLEIRSDGCQTLVEPSVHPNGERYVWDRNGASEPLEIATGELVRSCTKLATSTVLARHMPPVGGRHEYALAAIGLLMRRLGKETALEITRAAWHAADADSAEALRDLEGIAADTERRLSEYENVFGAPALSEMAPALPKLLSRWWGWQSSGAANTDGGAGGEKPTEDELRDRWIGGRQSPTAYGQGEWRRYAGGFWAPVHQEVVNLEVDGVLEAAKPDGIRPTAGMRASVERLARAKTFVPDEVWDADADVLVCANGTLEVSSGTLREHRPGDYALGAVPYDFDPDAHAPAFYEFLMSTVPDAAPFLQEFVGLSLTTDTSLETAVWLYGPPGSGKSTFIEGIRAALGHRAGLLGLADVQRSQFALADLPGKTLVVATEQPADYIRSTDVLNAIISGEAIRVEQKYKPAYAVVPRAKVLWAMNDLPRIKDANSGLFRRVKVVPFPRLRVPPDPRVKERIKDEGPGILVWGLEGLRRLLERGHFEVPEAVREATEEFRRTSDVPAVFVAEVCVTSDVEGCETQAQELYNCYRLWCSENGHKPMSSTAMAKEWRRLGFGQRSLNGRKFYVGVKVEEGWIKAREDHFGGR